MERKQPKLSLGARIKNILSYELGNANYRSFFFDSLATMLAAGLDIREILLELEHETHSRKIKEMIHDMRSDVENGLPIWKVIARQHLISEQYIALIRIGEQSGNLPENLNIVVEQMMRDREFKNQMRSASLYPSIVFTLLIIVALLLMTFVLPRIASVYDSLKIDLPGITKIMIAAGNFFGTNVAIAFPVMLVAIILLIYLLFYNVTVKHFIERIALRLPGIGKMLVELEVSRLGFMLANLLKSGIPLNEAMRFLAQAASINDYAKLYEYIAFYVEKGYSLEAVLNGYPHINRYLPVYTRQLMINGERTRKLPENMDRMGTEYERRNKITVKDMGTIFEPILLLVVWVGVALFSIAVILPIYSIMGQLNNAAGGAAADTTPTPTPAVVQQTGGGN